MGIYSSPPSSSIWRWCMELDYRNKAKEGRENYWNDWGCGLGAGPALGDGSNGEKWERGGSMDFFGASSFRILSQYSSWNSSALTIFNQTPSNPEWNDSIHPCRRTKQTLKPQSTHHKGSVAFPISLSQFPN
jgi:hypothetical protein